MLVTGLLLVALFEAYLTSRAALPGNGWAGVFHPTNPNDLQWVVVRYSWLPRVVVAILAGASLALAGTIFQHVLRNPLAEPTTLGVAAGANLGVTVVTIWFPSLLLYGREWSALLGGGVAFAIVFVIAWSRMLSPLVLILGGLVVNLCTGAISTVLSLIYGEGLSGVFIWQSGVLNQNNWTIVWYLLPRLILAAVLMGLLARPLSILVVGDAVTRGLGVSLRPLRAAALIIATALTACVVSAIGIIGFVGLAGPVLAQLTGARTLTQRLLWGALIGAAVLLVADQAVQLPALASLQIPTGVVTAVLGAPLLIWLLPRLRGAVLHGGRTTGFDGAKERSTALILSAGVVLVLALACFAVAWGNSVSGWHVQGWEALAPVFSFRAPRMVGALSAGLLLGVSGVLMQRLTANPMASPEVLGISSGASLGLILILFLVQRPDELTQLGGAALGALAILATMFMLGRKSGFSPERLVLAGVAVGTVFSALASLLMASGDPRMSILLSWMSGSTYRVRWPQAGIVFGVAAFTIPLIYALARPLWILPLGEHVAKAIGVHIGRTRLALLLLISVMTAGATLIVGPISFVGLMAPHIARMLGLRRPMPQVFGGAVIGAGILVFADWLGRNLLFPYQIPAGLLAAFIGGPYFLFLLWRERD